MDPNETLRQLRALLGGDHSGYEEAPDGCFLRHDEKPARTLDDLHTMVCEAEELWQALDGWIMKGGALPAEWMRAQRG